LCNDYSPSLLLFQSFKNILECSTYADAFSLSYSSSFITSPRGFDPEYLNLVHHSHFIHWLILIKKFTAHPVQYRLQMNLNQVILHVFEINKCTNRISGGHVDPKFESYLPSLRILSIRSTYLVRPSMQRGFILYLEY
jgi:hypothetical protein